VDGQSQRPACKKAVKGLRNGNPSRMADAWTICQVVKGAANGAGVAR
jgi:hypothetical protein